ncbi:hypothetical protein [Streptomyces sp. NPDC047315]|uniref:hypothetical protein n=1 Tax=Streptomyces sp. NPDC047315 TaxID=3155142 RepID=UPI0033F93C4B
MPTTIRRRATLGALSLLLAVPLGLAAAPAAGAAESPVSKTVAQYQQDWNSLNGYRLRQVGTQAIFVVIDGKRRWVPDMSTYNNLFGTMNIHEVVDLYRIPDGGPLSSGAFLATAPSSDTVWLISNGLKRGITGPAFAKYEFDWSKIEMLRDVVLNAIPQGPNVEV